MKYLYSLPTPVKHINLSLQNCFIDNSSDKWTIKISDYGTKRSKLDYLDYETIACSCPGALRYIAPEMTLGELYIDDEYTYQQDVYAYGILFWEVYHILYAFKGYPNQLNLLRDVVKGARPRIGVHAKSTPYARLMECCWHRDPQIRPSFTEIIITLENVSKTHK